MGLKTDSHTPGVYPPEHPDSRGRGRNEVQSDSLADGLQLLLHCRMGRSAPRGRLVDQREGTQYANSMYWRPPVRHARSPARSR